MITINELKELLAYKMDALELIEMLELTPEDILERFDDIVERKFDELYEEVCDDEEH